MSGTRMKLAMTDEVSAHSHIVTISSPMTMLIAPARIEVLSSRCVMKDDLRDRRGSWNLCFIVQITLISANMLERSSRRRQFLIPPPASIR